MEDAPPPPKKSTTLSVDRAAFLLLRVKKAFKKKRQQRKEKQTQAANAALISQARSGRKLPPPLLRSRTLPAIIVPGIPVVSLNTDRQFDERASGLLGSKSGSGTSTGGGGTNRWSLLTRQTPTTPGYTNNNNNNNVVNIKSLNLPKDDMGVYRRKSSGSTTGHSGSSASMSGTPIVGSQVADAALLMPTCEDFECHAADGSVLLRIPAPHVVAARAYRLAAKKRNTSSCTHDSQQRQHQQQLGGSNVSTAAGITTQGGNPAELQQPSTPEGTSSGGGEVTGSTANTALTRRLAKLLHQTSVSASRVASAASPHGDHTAAGAATTTNNLLPIMAAAASRDGGGHNGSGGGAEEAPRRLSWERRKDSSALQRSASIDSFAEIVFSDTPRPSLDIPRPSVVPFSKRPSASSLFSNCSTTSQTTQLNINYVAGGDLCSSGSSAGNSRRESLLSPSSTRRNKLTRIINDNIQPHSLTLDRASWRKAHGDKRREAQEEAEKEEADSGGVGSSYYFIDNTPDTADAGSDNGGFVDADADNVVVLRRAASAHSKNSSNNNNNNSSNINNNNNNRKRSDNAKEQYCSTIRAQQLHNNYHYNNSHSTQLSAVINGENSDDNGCDAANTFRWSEQWTPNVAVAKIRTAISCASSDLREMEFLLPQTGVNNVAAAAATTKTTTTATGSNATKMATTMSLSASNNNNNNNLSHHNNNSNNNKILRMTADKQRSNGTSSGLSVARQARNSVAAQPQAALSAKQPKINANESLELALKPPNLAIYRHSAFVRTKISDDGGGVGDGFTANAGAGNCGNTPYRNKMSKKQLKLAQAQLDKLNQINLHQHALFSAVEHGHLDKARTILESTDVDVNSINSDGLSALDVAVLSNNRSMTKMLLQHNAVEGTQFSSDTIGNKLNSLLKDAESRIQDLSGTSDGGLCQPTFTSRPSISSIIIGNTGSSVTGCTGNEIEKQIGIWERRVKGLRRLLLGWDQTRPPDAPASVTVDVTGDNSIALQILEPLEGAIATKFKVQWSTRADFSNIVGERELVDWTSFHGNMGTQCQVGGLTQGRRYFIRAACGNVKGWGAYKTSVPASVVPSSWRDFNNREDRYVGRQRVLDNLFTAVRLARPADVSELTLDVGAAQRRNPKKKTTIKQLFSVASKFQKHLRRGIYLASVVYCEDKVLVTSEDFLPVIEIDETYPSSLYSDYHWLMKVACTWDDVKSLRTDMERNLTSAVHFRTKLLSAVCQMQSTLGLNDLGQLFYKPLRDSHGTVVLTCIQSVKSQKTVSILNSRWLPLNKLQKKIVALLEDYNISEMLISSINEQIHYHQTSTQRLSPGLYLGYLKMQCSMDQIQVVVPVKTPNVLPHYKVRENSHITADEWQILKRKKSTSTNSRSNSPLNMALEFNTSTEETTEGQRLFLYDLTNAAHKLFAYMNIKPEDAKTHRLYDIEVIEHSKDISFLVICPAVELACAVPGQSELLLQRDDLASLSIQAFEMIHLRTYQPGIIQKYARLSCILELDTALATHSQREAFSTSELQTAKERLAKLQELSANLNVVWKSVRWLMDVIAFARDKNAQSSEIMKDILAYGNDSDKCRDGRNVDKQLLQPPTRDTKYTKSSGRGSWPGPGANSQSSNCLAAEHSKSEQNLGRSVITPTSCANILPPQQSATKSQSSSDSRKNVSSSGTQQMLQVSIGGYTSSDVSLRKNSGDSMTSSQYTTRSYYSGAESALGSNNELGQIFAIPPSRSDDTLALGSLDGTKHSHSAATHRKRTSSNITQHVTTPASLTSTTHGSSSAPYLPTGSNLSLKNSSSSDYDIKTSKISSQSAIEQCIVGKVKAASSANLRDGALYLKPTHVALPDGVKSISAEEASATAASATTAKTASIKSLSRQSSEEDTASGSSHTSEQPTNAAALSSAPSSGIIQVYTAYNTGLASGTSLKLHVTPKTTAREVINLVVKQLNMAAVLKGNNGPIYTADMLENFCLVAVIGARERCLRDDFKPLQLQNPWRKGRLYVRQKHELLAAIEHANRKSHLI